jgi:hypothetical protein
LAKFGFWQSHEVVKEEVLGPVLQLPLLKISGGRNQHVDIASIVKELLIVIKKCEGTYLLKIRKQSLSFR